MEQWHQYLREKDSVGRKLKSAGEIIRRMRNAVVAVGFRTWQDYIYDLDELEAQKSSGAALMRRTMIRMLHVQLAAGFDVWRDAYMHSLEVERAIMQAHAERQNNATKIVTTASAIIRRLQYANLWQAWSSGINTSEKRTASDAS